MNSTRSESLTGTVEVGFPQFRTPPPEPMGLLREWLDGAAHQEVREPCALALATSGADGRTSSRIVVLNKLTETGLLFATHSGSRKGTELAANPWASGVLYWRETSRQITVAGPVVRLRDAEADALWAARAVFTHAMSSASRQSEPLEDLDQVAALRIRAGELGERGALPRPAGFAAYELRPERVEFWANGTDRLHERLYYERSGGNWSVGRLQP
ncbi:phenazine biosynthesis protein [Streptomyces sp. 150FB]|uniref:phenazine biosynthesis FMN-dependent oxidase PhzG n=1 Tax=Streptomyces sp. 150FB TaxID=1576605 RepID=UPI00058952C0|nr:phenazine biosynthesis FMN-dependent oxidase PhzG [Streptomyces sp. 150FB]KIF75065.1 phenazine biosynthesis protein [Streptomyces sp. 150FB]